MVNFDLFIIVWNNMQGMGTPAIHIKIAHWLSESYEKKDKELLLMAFRSCGKSTIVGLFCSWLLYRNPNIRIMVLSAEQTLARKMVQNVKRIIEKHPLTKHLKPKKKEEWASASFTVNRTLSLRDPSVIARGLNGNITGSRADFIICDDVEVPNTCDTSGKRETLREKLAELDYILTPKGVQLYVGTPHNFYTIYAKEAREEIGEEKPFLDGFKRLEVPVIKNGKSAWEEKYPLSAMDKVRAKTGVNKFDSQMLLKPTNVAEGRLNPDDLKIYEADLEYREANGRTVLTIMGEKLVGASCCWDPAFGSAKGDNSVIACVFTDNKGAYYLHDLQYIKLDHIEDDEATTQCKIVRKFAENNFLPSVEIETNGIGKFLPSLLRKELSGTSTSVIEHTATRNKEIRILEAFDAVLAGGALNVHKRVLQTAFATELREWRPENYKGHDDGLDAVARAINSQPIRIGSFRLSKNYNWQGSGESLSAETDFEV